MPACERVEQLTVAAGSINPVHLSASDSVAPPPEEAGAAAGR
eukprot:COSAG06_NODE_56929_length_282_cov_1.120219_1_plen_41_part_01